MVRNETVGQFTNLGVGLSTMAGGAGADVGTVNSAMNAVLNQTNSMYTNLYAPNVVLYYLQVLNSV